MPLVWEIQSTASGMMTEYSTLEETGISMTPPSASTVNSVSLISMASFWLCLTVTLLDAVPAVKVTTALRSSVVSFLSTEAFTVTLPAWPLAGERVIQDSEALAVQATLELMVMDTTPPSTETTPGASEVMVTESTGTSFLQETARAATSTVAIRKSFFITVSVFVG